MRCPCCKQELPEGHKLNKSVDGGLFERFWNAYPKRKGSNPKHPAKVKFEAAIRMGTDPDKIINGAAAYADEERKSIDTPYICQAATWLNQRRWEDYVIDPTTQERVTKAEAFMRGRGWEWNGQRWVKAREDAEPLY